MSIAQIENSQTNLARQILSNQFNGSFLYINKSEKAAINNDEYNDLDANNIQMNIYPNPANENITLQLSTGDLDNANVSIYDALGQKVYAKVVDFIAGESSIEITNLAKGTYIITLVTDKEFIKQVKFVKQ